LSEIYPGIDATYRSDPNGPLTLNLTVRPGADLSAVVFEIAKAVSIQMTADGLLQARLGSSRLDPSMLYVAPTAFQEGRARRASYVVLSTKRFGLQIDDRDDSLPLRVEMSLGGAPVVPSKVNHVFDRDGNTFVAVTVADAAGKDAPFAADQVEACGRNIAFPVACTDAVVYKISKSGDVVFMSFLSGRTREAATFIGIGPDGAPTITGTTDSADFPVSAAALQRTYGGPTPQPIGAYDPHEIWGDFFAAKLDPATGVLRTATYFGGPNGDRIGETVLAADGSVHFVHKWLGWRTAGMPVSSGALQRECLGDPCASGYAARIASSLDRLIYGTYLPGHIQATAKLHSDGSLYYSGTAAGGFPTTPGALQRQPVDAEDGIVARLDPSGSRLMFATYIGGPNADWILRNAVAPDGSIWVAVSSFVQCCIDIGYRLVRLDSNGSRILADKPIDVGDIAVDREGMLHATAVGNFTVGPDAFLANACAGSFLAYLKLSPAGEQRFATYLPGSGYDFVGISERGFPVLPGHVEVVEGQSMGVYAGCVVDAASFGNGDTLSPGAIVTLFGSRMGPRGGIAFHLEDGRVPRSLGGTRVLVNGEPVPILFASYWQVNAIMPYSLTPGSRPSIQVESEGTAGNEVRGSIVANAGVSVFRLDDSTSRPAAALNEDGTVNSPRNPAKRGSRVVLFGTGGGATVPPSTESEVTPLEPRALLRPPCNTARAIR
jgi:uncharacterized protein (TIGR03437 family)